MRCEPAGTSMLDHCVHRLFFSSRWPGRVGVTFLVGLLGARGNVRTSCPLPPCCPEVCRAETGEERVSAVPRPKVTRAGASSKGQREGLPASPQPRAVGKGGKMWLGRCPRAWLPFCTSCAVSHHGYREVTAVYSPHTSALGHAFIHSINRHSSNISESPLCAKSRDGFWEKFIVSKANQGWILGNHR